MVPPAPEWPESIRLVIIGGERVEPSRLATWQAQVGGRAVLKNTYGPTEATVVATVADLMEAGGASGPGREVPIGRPIANTRVYLLDGQGEPVPVGVPGELYLGGAGLARGYLGRRPDGPTLRPRPLRARAGGPALPDRGRGAVPGRRDTGVPRAGRRPGQAAGYRIEPGEIEATLRGHPGVADAAVVLRRDGPGDPRLVAYVVPRPGFAVSSQVLRSHLEGKLLEFIVPTPVGLVDDALRHSCRTERWIDERCQNLVITRPEITVSYMGPRTPSEAAVAAIWAGVLGLDRVGVEGRLLRARRPLAAGHPDRRPASRQAFGRELSLRQFFQAPTVPPPAAAVEALPPPADPAPALGPPSPRPDPPSAVCSPRRGSGSSTHWCPATRSITSRRLSSPRRPLDVGVLGQCLDAVARRHEAFGHDVPERRGPAAAEDHPRRVARPPLPGIDLRACDPASGTRFANCECRGPAAVRPCHRAVCGGYGCCVGRRVEHCGAGDVHHVVSDGWSSACSWRTGDAVRGVSTAAGRRRWGRCRCSTPTTPSAAVLAPQVTLERLLGYWRRRLQGASVLELPTDRPRPPLPSFRGATHRLVIEGEVYAGLKELSRREGSTLFMTLLGAFAVLLHRYSGQTDLCIGTPVANRTRSELEGLIGFFVNTLVLRVDLGGSPSFVEVLRRVREVVLEAYAHQDMPFEKLVAELLASPRPEPKPPLPGHVRPPEHSDADR